MQEKTELDIPAGPPQRAPVPRRGRRRMWLVLTLAAIFVSLAGLIAVTIQLVTEADLALQRVSEQADLSVRMRKLQGMLVSLVDAENAQRGYLLTENERYLAPYRTAIDRLPALMTALDDSALQDRAFDQKADEARQLISDKLAQLDQTIRLQVAGRHEQAVALLMSDKGRDDMERARGEINGVLDAVSARRDRIGQEISEGVTRIQHLLLLSAASLVVCIALAVGQVLQTLSTRSRFEAHLRLSEQRHRALIEDQSELVCLMREDGTIVYANAAFAQHYGRDPAQLIGSNRYDLADDAERAAMRMEVSGVLRSGSERRSETRSLAADGSERWISWMNKRRQEPEGMLLHSVGRDVTDRKRTERALRASQSFLHRTSRLAGVGGWEQDLSTGTGVWSEEVRRILEADDDYVPTRIDELESYAPEARETMAKAIADCVERGVSWDLELPRDTASGRRIWVRTMGSLEFENGQPRRIVGALQDVTERKLLQQRLADSERFLRQITDSLAVRIAYFDTRSRYRFVNLAHCKRFGKDRSQIIGRTRSEMMRGQTDETVERHIAAALRGEEQNYEYDEHMGGPIRRIAVHLLPDIGDNGRVLGFYATGVDITDRVAVERQLRDLTQILELNPDFIVQTDRLAGVQYMNPALRRALNLGATQSLAGRRFAEFNTPDTNERYAGEIQPALRRHGAWLGESTLGLADGRVIPVNHLVIAHRDASGNVERFSAVMRDISGEVTARNALMLQTATLQSVTEALPAMVAVVGRDGVYRFVNSAFERWVGKSAAELIGRRVADTIEPDEYQARLPWVRRALAGESVSFETHDPTRRIRHLSISYIPLYNDGQIDGYVGVGQDITLHKEETVRLLQLTQRDTLTGLLNRAGLEDWLSRREEASGLDDVALLHIGLDHFKPVNDTFGHSTGDAVLRSFGQRLQALVRPTDAVARLAGDQFALALWGMHERAHADAVAEKVVAAAAEPFPVGALDILVGASVGIAFQSGLERGGQSLIERADQRLYDAKAAGRGTFV